MTNNVDVARNPDNLFKRGDVWHIRYTADGKKVRYSLNTKSVKAAKRLRDEILGRRSEVRSVREKFGIAALPSNAEGLTLTFKEVADKWFVDGEERWRPQSATQAKSALDVHINPHFGAMPITNITPLDVKRFVTKLRRKRISKKLEAKRLSKDTMANVFRYVRQVFRFASREGLHVGRDPTDLKSQDRPRANPRGRQVFLTTEEAQALLGALQMKRDPTARRLYFMAITALYAGLRWNECNGLRWKDVDLTPGKETLRVEVSGEGETKTASSKALRDMSQILAAQLRVWADECISKEFVFPGRGGRPRAHASNQDNKAIQDAAKKAKIEKHVTAHVLRHSFATLIYQAVPDIEATRRLMRHSSVATTMRYIHDVRSLRDNVDALPSMLPTRKLKSV